MMEIISTEIPKMSKFFNLIDFDYLTLKLVKILNHNLKLPKKHWKKLKMKFH